MIYIIRSLDGQTVTCTPSASAAAKYAADLGAAGIAFTLNDLNGHGHDIAGLAVRALEGSPALVSAADGYPAGRSDETRRREGDGLQSCG